MFQVALTHVHVAQLQSLGSTLSSRPSVGRGELQVRAAESKDTSSASFVTCTARGRHLPHARMSRPDCITLVPSAASWHPADLRQPGLFTEVESTE